MKVKREIDPVTDYAKKVVRGRIIAGPWVRAACQRHLDDLERGEKRGLFWDKEKAIYAINFFPQTLKLAEGRHAGKPFELEPSQKFIIGSIFGWMGKDGARRFRTAYIEQGKGSGKTPLAAGIGLYGLIADKEMGSEVYAAAVTRDQAGILFRDAVLMVEASPLLSKRIDKTAHNLAFIATQSFFRPISSEGRSLDGKRVHMALIDEIHEHRTPIVVDKMRAGTKGRKQALIFEITNSGYDRESICYYHHDYSIKVVTGAIKNDSWFSYVCALDDGDDWRDRKVWLKANPLLGVSMTKKYLEEQVLEAEGMPAKQGVVKRLNFCIWTEGQTQWIRPEIWKNNGETVNPSEIAGKIAFGGLDLSEKNDLSALSLVIPLLDGTFSILSYFWLPDDALGERELRDGVPYLVWKEKGFIKTTPGSVVDYAWIANQLIEISEDYEIKGIAFDRWGMRILKPHLDEAGVRYWVKEKEDDHGDGIAFIPHGQGYRDMSPAVTALEDALLQGKIRHGMHPVLTWNAANAELMQDPAGNRKIVKGRNPNKRVDGIVALAMAMSLATGAKIQAKAASVYETRGLLGVKISKDERRKRGTGEEVEEKREFEEAPDIDMKDIYTRLPRGMED
jgi:phage terminase large subunit-like protein